MLIRAPETRVYVTTVNEMREFTRVQRVHKGSHARKFALVQVMVAALLSEACP